MNIHAYPAQQYPATNQSQNSVKFVIDELTGQHQGLVEHLVSVIDQHFGILQEICQGIARHQAELTIAQRRIAAETEQSRRQEELKRNEMQSLLSSHLSRLEIDVGALDSKVDSLGHEIHQIEANLTPVEECTRVIEESMKKAIDILRDPKRPSDAPQATSTSLHDTASAMGASTGSSTAVATDAHFGGVVSRNAAPLRQPKRRKIEAGVTETSTSLHSTHVLASPLSSEFSELTELEQEDSKPLNGATLWSIETVASSVTEVNPDTCESRA